MLNIRGSSELADRLPTNSVIDIETEIDQTQRCLSTHYQESLRYGDSIYLVGKVGANKLIQMVNSYISSPFHQIVKLDDFSYGENANPLPDLHMSAFRVLYPNQCIAEKALISYKNEMRNSKAEDETLSKLQSEAKDEAEKNRNRHKKHLGVKITYGKVIQLQHYYSRKYLGVSDSQTSIVDRTLLKVSLFDTNREHVQFKISPKYKVRAIGDKVRIEDEIILENLKCQQYLHYSEIEKSDSFFEGKEINASAEDSIFTIYSHIRLNNENDEVNNIRGGSVIRLYHLQVQCYVVAPGPGWDQGKEVMTDEVHLRARKIMLGNLKAPSTSAITYWQVENTKSPISGDILKYGEPCRIKHMLTQRYLSIEPIDDECQMKLINLADDISGESTQFHFTPFIDKGRGKLKDELIKFGNCARLYHPATKTWVKGTKEEFQGKFRDAEQLVTRGIKWDDASCYQINLELSKGFHDAYKLEMVDEQLLEYFHYAIGYISVIKDYLFTYDCPKSTREIEQSLNSLANWMQNAPNSKDMKNRQKLLRNLGIIELLMEIQKRFVPKTGRQAESKDYLIRKNTTVMVYTVIEAYLTGHSRKNENYTAKYIDSFKDQFGLGINAEQTLIELIRDNNTIIKGLSKRFQELTEKLFNELAVYKIPQIFYYFGVMCVTNKSQFQNNQLTLAKRLSESPVEDFMFKMRLDKSDEGYPKLIATSPLTLGKHYKPLSEYVPIDDSIELSVIDQSIESIDFLMGQLDFLSNLCKGNNKEAITMLTNKFPFEIIFSGMRDEHIHPKIRRKFAELLSTMYIDVGSNRPILENLTLTFIFDECKHCKEFIEEHDSKSKLVALSGEWNDHFDKIKYWLRDYFEHLKINCHEDFLHMNRFTASVLDVLLLFVKFGYYKYLQDINNILCPLLRILNGLNDRSSSNKTIPKDDQSINETFITEGRFQKNEGNAPIVDIKKKCLRVFELFMNLRKHRRLKLMLSCYREFRKQFEDTSNRRTIFEHDHSLAHHLNDLHSEKVLLNKIDLTHKLKNHLNIRIIATTAYEYEKNEGTDLFQSILLDLTRYKDRELSVRALHLLNVKYSTENDLFMKAIQAQALTNESSVELFKNFESKLPRFRRLLKSSFTNPNKRVELIGILKECTRACRLPEYPTRPHRQNQQIFFNFGLFEDVLNILEKFQEECGTVTTSTAGKDDIRELAQVSCTLLQHLAKDNLQIQNRLYNRLEILASEYLFKLAPVELGNLLSQIFTGAEVIVMNIKPKEIRLICSLMKPEENLLSQNIAPIIEILKAIAKVEEIDLPVHINQVQIMKSFMQNKPNEIDMFLGTSDHKMDLRNRLLTSNDLNEEELMQLEVMLSTFDLMASLCEGENQHHESVCQSMISVGELLDILNNTDIPYSRKFQFASFFNWAYLNTHKMPSMYDISIQNEPQFWPFLMKSNALLEKFITLVTVHSNHDHYNFRQANINEDETLFKPKLHLSTPNKDICSFEWLCDYLLKGILPIIIVFYTRYFSIDTKVDVECIRNLNTTMNICNNLIDLAIKFQPFIETKHQARLLYTAPLSIITNDAIKNVLSEQSSIEDEKLLEFKKLVENEATFVPQSLVDYNRKYKGEIWLNDQFNNYAKHMRRAYWGENTAKVQIGAPTKEKVYSIFLDEAGNYPALDSMPLGPKFQEHLGLFFEHTKDGCSVDNDKLFISIVKQLEYSYENYYEMDEREKVKQESLDLKSLQLLRGAILNEIRHIDIDLKTQNLKEYHGQLKKVVKIQNDIANLYTTTSIVLTLTSHPCKPVSFQSIALLIDMLYGGNVIIQEKLRCLADSSEGKFLERMSTILYNGGSTIKENRKLKIQVDKRRLCFENTRGYLDTLVVDNNTQDPTVNDLPDNNITNDITENDLLICNEGVELMSLQKNGQENVFTITTEELRSKENKLLGEKMLTEKITKKNRLRKIEVAVKLLGLMCDGHCKFMQNYLRKQDNGGENINIIYKAVNFLKDVHTEITKYNISLVTEVFSTIIELIDGNYSNKVEAFDARIIDVVNHIFQTPIQKSAIEIEQEVDLYKSMILFLKSIMEETSMGTKVLAKELYNLIDIDSIHCVLGRLYEIKFGKECQDQKVRTTAEDYMFHLYHFILHSKEFNTVSKSDQDRLAKAPDVETNSKANKAWVYCAINTRSIEIVYETDEKVPILNKIRFKCSNSAPNDVVEAVKWGINRQSPEDKLRDFLEWFKAVKETEDYSKKLRDNKFIKEYIKFQSFRQGLFLFWTFLVNLFLLATWYTPCGSVSTTEVNDMVTYDCNEQTPNSTLTRPLHPIVPFWYNYVFYPIGVIHLIMALDLLILFFIVNWKNFYIPDIFHRIRSISYHTTLKYKFKWEDPKDTKYLKINIFGSKVAFMCIIFLSSLLSLPLRGYLYPICLLYVLKLSDILRRVLLAVTKNGKSLIFVAFFGCIILYIFGVIGFALFSIQAQSTINPDSEAYIFCHTLYECFVSIGRWGLLDTIGQFIPQRSMSFTGELDRIIFDLLFFIIVNTIGLNIVFGIIVDTFSQLRDEKSEQEKDMKNYCFICGLENYVFDRKGSGFRNHVKNEHNMWDYYSFFLYLDSIDPCDHTAIEGFVFKKLKDDETIFFPQNVARCIVNENEDQDDQLRIIIKELQDQNEILRSVNNLKSTQKKK